MRNDGEREKKSEEGRDARMQDRLRLLGGVGMDTAQRVEERLPRESLVKWKSITSTLNHLNWFRHGPKARFSHALVAWGWATCTGRCMEGTLHAVSRKEGGGEEKMRGGKYRWGRKVKSEEEKEEKWGGVCIEEPVSIARGFTLSSPFLSSSPPARILLFLLLVLSCCSSSVCGEPQIIRINIITSSGAASLFLSPRSTHHDVTHDRFRAPVKPLSSSSSPPSSAPFAFLPTVDSFYLVAAFSIANSTGP